MDREILFREMIERLESWPGFEFCEDKIFLSDVATTIKTLLEERDAAREKFQDLKIMWDMYGGSEGITAAFEKAAERDAAVNELKFFADMGDGCHMCKHSPCAPQNNHCLGWEWRGPQK